MKVLITGAYGQLGFDLRRAAPAGVQLLTTDYDTLNIADEAAVAAWVEANKPDAIINAAAYTAVDKAETDAETADQVNHIGAGILARQAAQLGIAMIHVSTDFIFDGTAHRPYPTDATPNPISVYGKTKLDGERAVLAAGCHAAIVRTAWVYSSHGNNFVKTMLRLMNEREDLGIISDQIGSPTWAAGLAQCCWSLLESGASGTYHWTDAGVASWYDFAVAIYRIGTRFGLIENHCRLRPLQTEDYPTPAKRPPYSVMDKSGTWRALPHPPAHWEDQLEAMMKELCDG